MELYTSSVYIKKTFFLFDGGKSGTYVRAH